MMNITTEDLVKYMYNETSVKKAAAIAAALQNDWNLRQSYEKLVASGKNLNKINFSPRPETVNNILEYASRKRMPVASH